VDLFIGPRVKNTVLFGLHNIYQRQSWKYYMITTKMKHKKTFSNLKQNQKCSLSQVELSLLKRRVISIGCEHQNNLDAILATD
jgi:hypothetical protein